METKKTEWIGPRVGESDTPVRPVIVDSLIGEAAQANQARLYLGTSLCPYIDVQQTDILHTDVLTGSDLPGGYRVVLNPDAVLTIKNGTLAANLLAGKIADTLVQRAQFRQELKESLAQSPAWITQGVTSEIDACPSALVDCTGLCNVVGNTSPLDHHTSPIDCCASNFFEPIREDILGHSALCPDPNPWWEKLVQIDILRQKNLLPRIGGGDLLF